MDRRYRDMIEQAQRILHHPLPDKEREWWEATISAIEYFEHQLASLRANRARIIAGVYKEAPHDPEDKEGE